MGHGLSWSEVGGPETGVYPEQTTDHDRLSPWTDDSAIDQPTALYCPNLGFTIVLNIDPNV